jgi:hypothetical protein
MHNNKTTIYIYIYIIHNINDHLQHIGQALLEFDAFRRRVPHVDMVLQAYSTNDMHIQSVLEAAEEQKTLGDMGMEYAQNFVRTLWGASSSCNNNNNTSTHQHRPLLLWIDDYLGNEQRSILATTELNQKIQVLASYYGFASLSLGNAVRDLVYANTHEKLFSPQWYNGDKDTIDSNMVRQIHPEQGMHLSMMYIVAYNILNMFSTYCNSPASPYETTETTRRTLRAGLPEYSNASNALPLFPHDIPHHVHTVLPPPLTPTLSLEHVSAIWHYDAQMHDNASSTSADCDDTPQCFFSWVNGLDPTHTATHITALFQPYILDSGNWTVTDYRRQGKYGWGPIEGAVNSTMTLQFNNVTQPIRRVGLFYVKSYGAKWDRSVVRFSFFAKNHRHNNTNHTTPNNTMTRTLDTTTTIITSSKTSTAWSLLGITDVKAYHDKHTTEMYVERVALDHPVAIRDSLRLDMTLINGTSFKLQGLALCS